MNEEVCASLLSSSLSGEDENQTAITKFLHKLTEEKLSTLSSKFKEKHNGLNKEEFVFALQNVVFLDNPTYIEYSSLLFTQIINAEDGLVKWDQFLDFLISNRCNEPKVGEQLSIFNILNPPHVKRDTIVKIVLLETNKYFSYAVLAKYGHVGIYDGNMNFLFSYQTIMCRADLARKEEEKRRRNRWITDAIFLPSVLMFVIISSARSITIYDASSLKHTPLWLIISFPTNIQCLTHCANNKENTLTLYLGDEIGTVTSLKFMKAKEGLLPRKQNDKLSIFYWCTLPNERKHLLIDYMTNMHSDKIKMIEYYSDNKTLVTCSKDPQSSVVIKYLDYQLRSYVFKMKLGATCFSLSRSLKLMVTGSDDGLIRLWSIVNDLKPLATFKEHQTCIIDVKIFEIHKMFLSYSRDGTVKLWDILDEKLIQSIAINFPSFEVLGNLIEWGTKSIFPGPKRKINNQDPNANDDFEIFNGSSRCSSRLSRSNCIDDPWIRSTFLITCCNFICTLQINGDFEMENAVLPPPPLQHSVLIPKDWAILLNDNLKKEVVDMDDIDEDISSISLQSLDFLLNRDLLSELNAHNDIHRKLSMIEQTKRKMSKAVENGAPYLALDLFPIEDIKINENLPIPNDKKTKALVEKTQRMLSAANSRSVVFSENSSSRTKSSRSSVVSFD